MVDGALQYIELGQQSLLIVPFLLHPSNSCGASHSCEGVVVEVPVVLMIGSLKHAFRFIKQVRHKVLDVAKVIASNTFFIFNAANFFVLNFDRYGNSSCL